MRILHTVEFYSPSVGGMEGVVKQLSERLVEKGHEVTVATQTLPGRDFADLNGVRVEQFNVSGSFALGLRGDLSSYSEFLTSSRFDLMTNFGSQQWATDVALLNIKEIKAKKVFVPTGFGYMGDARFSGYYSLMPHWIRQYDANVFLSDPYRDIDFARLHGARGICLIPNAADEREFLLESDIDIRTALGIPSEHLLILHVGNHTGVKGHKEAFEIFRTCRVQKATFLLVGNESQPRCLRRCRRRERRFRLSPMRVVDRKRFIVRSLTRDETVACLKAADLFLFPSEIECSPLVIFECLASRTPFLSTDVGNVREIADLSGSGVILPGSLDGGMFTHANIGESARLLAELATDEGRRKEMAERGFIAWKKRFSWDRAADRYEELYRRLLNCE